MRYELFIAARHITSKKGRSLSLVTTLAIAGVALGVAALVGGLSITKGFEDAFRDKLLGVTAHIFARPYTSARYEASEIEEHIKRAVPEVVGVAPTTYHKTILSGPGGTTGGFIKGLDPERASRVLKLADYMIEGSMSDLTPGASPTPTLIGVQLAERMGVGVGDHLTALSVSQNSSGRAGVKLKAKEQFGAQLGADMWSPQQGAPTSFTFKVAGIFRAGYDEYDARFAYVHISDAERIFGTQDNVRGFEIKVQDPDRAAALAPQVANAIKWGFGGPLDWAEGLTKAPLQATKLASRAEEQFHVQDWYAQNPTLYMSLLYQRLAILVVLSVMLILAACNVASMMIMMGLERTKDIAILKAMGASERSMKMIFHAEGLVIAMIGSVVGAALGFAFCELLLGRGVSLDPKVYGIDHFPVSTSVESYMVAVTCSLLIVGIAVAFPAKRSAALKPTDGLREDQLEL